MRLHLLPGIALAVLLAGCDTRTNPVIAGLDEPPRGSPNITIRPNALRLTVGQTAQLVLITDRILGPFTWTSSLPGVASVSNEGLVTAIGTGTATITVFSGADPRATASATVSVQPSESSP